MLRLSTFCPRKETLFRRWWPECPPELMMYFRHLGCQCHLCRYVNCVATWICKKKKPSPKELFVGPPTLGPDVVIWKFRTTYCFCISLKKPQYQGLESQQWVIQGQEGEWREGSIASPETLSYFWPQCRQCPAWWVSWHHQTSWQFEVGLSSTDKYSPTRRVGLSPQFWQKTWNKGFFELATQL